MTPDRFRLIERTLRRRQPDLSVLADGVHKTHNVAAVVRTCDAVGVLDVHAVSPGGEIPRHHATNAGSSRWTRLHTHSDIQHAAEALKQQGFTLVAAHLSSRAVDFRALDYRQPTAIMLGTELDGVSQAGLACADEHVMIPMMGMVESLNVSVAAAVILYEAQRQRAAAGLYDTCRIPDATYRHILFEWCYPDIARRCREKQAPYPNLDENGQMLSNPLTT
ncbi:MAG: tRNA (guanosine(18)-2'-O)-methyltransferase TrmH [Pseudomonadota bacterium]